MHMYTIKDYHSTAARLINMTFILKSRLLSFLCVVLVVFFGIKVITSFGALFPYTLCRKAQVIDSKSIVEREALLSSLMAELAGRMGRNPSHPGPPANLILTETRKEIVKEIKLGNIQIDKKAATTDAKIDEKKEELAKNSIEKTEIEASSKVASRPYFLIHDEGHYGRFGNHMFMYAGVRSLAKSTGRKFVYRSKYEALKAFGLNGTQLPEHITDLKKVKRFGEKLCCSYDSTLIPKIKAYKGDVHPIGYFQSWKYFADNQYEIRRTFQLKGDVKSKALDFLNGIRNNRSTSHRLIGLHIRRGDMMYGGNVRLGFTVSNESYIYRAMAYFEKRHPCVFVVTGNDMNWNKRALKGYEDRTVFIPMDYSKTGSYASASFDFAVLTQCDHLILTVGTYGWWAAFLSNGEVVYDKDWPRKGSKLYSYVTQEDYFLPGWTGL